MLTERRVILLLQAALVVLFAVLVVLQTLSFPGQFAHMAKEEPATAEWRWPLTVLFAYWLLCVQVVIVCIWKLLGFVKRDRIFSSVSMVWVNTILGAVAAAWIVLVGVFVSVVAVADDPGAPLLLFLVLTGVTVVGLLMVVMRALLRQATSLRTDLEAVI